MAEILHTGLQALLEKIGNGFRHPLLNLRTSDILISFLNVWVLKEWHKKRAIDNASIAQKLLT